MSSLFRSVSLALVTLLFVACASTGNQGAQAQSAELLYVCNQGAATISVIDTQSLEIIKTIDLQELGFSENAKPHHIAVLDDGTWFVSLIGDNKVVRFSPEDEMLGTIDYEVPGMLILNKEKNQILVGRSMSAVNPPMRIGFIDPQAVTVEEIEVFYPRPHALNVHPNGEIAYSASLAQNSIGVIDTEEGSMDLLNLGGPPHAFVQFAVSPDGETLVGTSHLRGQLLFFDVTNPSEPQVVDSVAVNAAPWHPLFSHDGKFIYFGNKMASTITVVDAETRAVHKVIEGNGISEPHGSSLTPDGSRLFISNNNLKGGYGSEGSDGQPVGTVVVIDTETLEIEKVIEVGANATGLSPIIKRP